MPLTPEKAHEFRIKSSKLDGLTDKDVKRLLDEIARLQQREAELVKALESLIEPAEELHKEATTYSAHRPWIDTLKSDIETAKALLSNQPSPAKHPDTELWDYIEREKPCLMCVAKGRSGFYWSVNFGSMSHDKHPTARGAVRAAIDSARSVKEGR